MRKKIFAATLVFCAIVTHAVFAEFSTCRFNFGMAWQGTGYNYPNEIDYVTIWAGSDENWNDYWIGDMLRATKSGGQLAGKTPVLYSYIIAFTARRDWGLGDCDVSGSNNLCDRGANFIREEWSRVTGQYEKYASNAARVYGTSEPIIWLMEPDYYQYSYASQLGGGLSASELAQKMDELVSIIKNHLPNAKISLDISPWTPDQRSWFNAFNLSDFSFTNTSGGRTDANSQYIRNENNTTWRSIYDITGKGIIADDGYGVGGGNIGHDDTWDDVNNLNDRIADGVIAITQAEPRSDWGAIIAGIRPMLNTPRTCASPPPPSEYSLSVSTSGAGTVNKSPDQSSYSAGTGVSLTAQPATGYVFAGWSGDLSGADNPATITMNENKTVAAIFTEQGGTPPPPPPSGDNMITNGNFSGGANSWNLGVYGGAVAAGAVSGGEYKTTIMSSGTAAWNVQLTQSGLSIESGKTYTLSFKARADANRTVNVNVGRSSSPWTSYVGAFDVDLTTSMQTFTKTFTMEQGSDANARVEFNSGLSSANWYLDDVSLVEAGGSTPPPQTYTIDLTAGAGGSVSKSPDAASYESGATVSLTAIADAGYEFSGWSGDLSGTENPVSITIDADKNITATFSPQTIPTYSVTITTNGQGSVSKSPDQSSYQEGSTVALSATPAAGYVFSGWAGDLSGADNPASMVMNSDKAVTATFTEQAGTPPPPPPSGDNMITNGNFSDGAASWSLGVYGGAVAGGAVTGGEYKTTIMSSGTAAWNVQMTQAGLPIDNGKTYTLTFKARADANRTVNVNIGMSSSPWTSYVGAFDVDLTTSMQTFTTTFTMEQGSDANARVEFNSGLSTIDWHLDDVVLVEGDGQTNPNPNPDTYTLDVTVDGDGSVGTSPEAANYEAGTPVTLTATPAQGYVFSGWSGDLEGVDNPATLTVNANMSVTASFTEEQGGGGPTPDNMLVNGSFEDGTSSWQLGAYGGARANGSVANDEYVTTIYKKGSADWNVQMTQGNLGLEQGKTYTLTFKARAERSRSIQVNVGMSSSPYQSYMGAMDVELTTTMRTFSKTFTMSAATDANARVEFNSGRSSVNWYLDDVELVEGSGEKFAKKAAPLKAPFSLRTSAVSANSIRFMLSGTEYDSYTLTIFDRAGRTVYRTNGKKEPGLTVKSWNLRSNGGTIVAAGSYIAVVDMDLRGGGKKRAVKVFGITR